VAGPATPDRPAAPRAVSGIARLTRAWRAMEREQRFAAICAFVLFLTMFLPWYDRTLAGRTGVQQVNQSAISVFSFVEAAVLLVAVATLSMLFARAERRAFHLPGGDGAIVTAAGAWASLLIVWRLFDKPDSGRGAAIGIHWGIFVALTAAAALAYAGRRINSADRPEPPLPGRVAAPSPASPAAHQPAPAAAPLAPSRPAAPPARAPSSDSTVEIPEYRPHLDETEVIRAKEDPPPAHPHPAPTREDEPDDDEQPTLPGLS
jgi:hypothetical protein